ncbi:cytochrome P450 85A-like isoform X2 [Wolffia australiana]
MEEDLGWVFAGMLGLIFVCVFLVRRNELMFRDKGLPPGSMGWPLFGETIEFLRQGCNFSKIRSSRHGSLFKTNVLRCALVVSMDPQVNKFILMNERKGLVPGYPQSMLDFAGTGALPAMHGDLHKFMRGILLSLFGPSAIREQLLPKVDSFMQSYLDGLSGHIVDIQEKAGEMTFRLPLKLFAGIETGQAANILVNEFRKLVRGGCSLPINIRGTSYHRALLAKGKIVSIFEDILRERRSCACDGKDILDALLHGDEKAQRQITNEQIIGLLITIIFAGHDTVTAASMMAFKYLHNHPRALQEAREEHLEIRKRKSSGEAINWEDYKSMTFTRGVILETLRLASIIPGVLRKTTENQEINGFTIPRGWKVYVCTREYNYDPVQYHEPLAFDPWRWQDKSLETHQFFTLFGGGTRLCPGKELGIVQISMFLHYFLTRCEEVGDQKIVQYLKVEAPKGLRFRVSDI